MWPIIIAVGVGVVAAIVLGIVVYKANSYVNDIQYKLNKVENRLDAAGASWLAKFISAAVVGDASSLRIYCEQFIEQDDITGFFLDNISLPLAKYSIKETAEYYPEKFEVLVQEVEASKALAERKAETTTKKK